MVKSNSVARRLAKLGLALSLAAPGLVNVAQAATSVSMVTVTFGAGRAASSTAGVAVEYQVDFVPATAILSTDTITLQAPAGTTFPSNTPASYQVEVVPTVGSPTPTTVPSVTPTSPSTSVTLALTGTSFTAVAGQDVRVLIGGLPSSNRPQNPQTASTTYQMMVSTSEDTTPAASADYTITAGATDPTVSTASASASSLVADGSTASTVTVTLKDMWANVESGKTVTLTPDKGSSAVGTASNGGVTDASGVVTFPVSDAIAEGPITYTATDTTDGVQVVQQPQVTFVPGADGSGSDSISPTSVVAGASGTYTLSYTPVAGMKSGTVRVAIPAGWSAPSTVPTAAGYTTTTDGTLGTSGQLVTVSNLSIAAGHTMQIVYGSATGGGPLAASQTSAGTASFALTEASSSTGTLSAVSPALAVTVNHGPVNAGTSMAVASPTSVPADGATQSTVTVTLEDANGNPVSGKAVSLTPSGGSSTVGAASGASDSAGHVTFKVSDASAETVTYTATDTTDGGGIAVSQQPSVTFTPDVDGSGHAAISPTSTAAGSTGGTYVITYTPTDGITNGKITVSVPTGWSAPTSTAGGAGYVTSSVGGVAVSGQLITVSGVTTAAAAPVTITYGSKAFGSTGATAQPGVGSAPFAVSETSSLTGTPQALSTTDTTVTVNPGTVSTSTSTVTTNHSSVLADGSSAATITVTLKDANGNAVPGKTVSLAATPPGQHSSIGSASGPSDSSGVVTFSVTDVWAEGPLTFTATDTTDSNLVLTSHALVTFTAPADGSGTAVISPTSVTAGSTKAYTITFTTPAGLNNGSVTVTVPSGWTAPSTATITDAGFTTTSTGTLSVSGSVITVSALTITAGSTVTITYGNQENGLAPGATAQTTAGTAVFTTKEASTSGGTLTALASSPTVTVTAGPASAGNSHVSSSPSSVVADGVTASTVTVTLHDQFNNPVSGKTVTLHAGSGSSHIGAASGPSDSSGVVTFPVTDTTAEGPITYTATDTTDSPSVAVTQTAQVTFVSGAVSKATSTVVASPASVPADGTTASTVTVTLLDGQGNPVSGKTVTLQAGAGHSHVGTASGPSDSGGAVTFAVTDTVVEGPITYTATDTTDSNLVITQAASVTFVPGPASAALSTVTASPTSVVSDGTTASTVTVTLRDAESHPIPGDTVTLAPQSGSSAVGAASGPSDSNGQVTFQVTDVHAEGPISFKATDTSGTPVAVSQQPAITFTRAPDGSGVAVIAPSSAAASSSSTYTITYTPAAGIPSGKVTVTIPAAWSTPSTTMTAPGYTTASTGTVSISSRVVTVSGITLAAGQPLTITYGDQSQGGTGAAAQTTTGSATFPMAETSSSGGTPLALASSPSVTVTPGPVSASHSTVSASPTSALADGSTTSTITVTLVDANNNPISGKTVALGQGAGHSVIGSASGATDSAGKVTFGVKDGTAEAVTYTATDSTDGNVPVTQTAGVTFTPPADGNGTAVISPTHLVESSTADTLSITYTPTAGITNGELSIAVPAPWAAPSTTATNPGYTKSTAGTAAVLGQTITVTGLTLAAGSPVVVTYGNTTGGGPGLTAPTAAGDYAFTTKQASTSTGTLTGLATSPVETVDVGPVSASASTLSSNPGSVIADGTSSSTITVTLTDKDGNPIAGRNVTLSQGTGQSVISAPSGPSDTAGVVTFTVTDTHAETVTYAATDSDDSVDVIQTVPVTFVPGNVSAGTSSVGASPISVVADGSTPSTITVVLTDAEGNPVPGKTVTLSQGLGHSAMGAASGPSDGAGTVTFSVTDTTVEQVMYSARDTTDGATITQTATVSFVHGAVSAGTSTVSASPTSVPADGSSQSTLTVTLLDAQSHPVAGKTVTLSGGTAAVTAVQNVSDAAGHAVFTVTDTSEGAVAFVAHDTSDGTALTQTATVTFTHVSTLGYWMVASDGGIFSFGSAQQHFHGSMGGTPLNQPVVGMAAMPDGDGYFLVASDGGIFSFGSARAHFHGSMGGTHLNAPIVGMAVMPDGDGYFLVASDGGIFSFGSARAHFHGSMGGTRLNQPVVGMALMPDGDGYFLVAKDGGIFTFGSARPHYQGSTGGTRLNQPVVGMALMPDGDGYFLVASDGGIFSFGSARPHFQGSLGGTRINQPVVGMAMMPDGDGYFLVAADGGIFTFGTARPHFLGSTGGTRLNQPIVGMTLINA